MLLMMQRISIILVISIAVFTGDLEARNSTLVPKPIHIRVNDLPKPFATPSADKDANIVPVPDNPNLFVPDGFTIKLWAKDLIRPRFLTYTPTGDILVSEPGANRISCLIDNDKDGYPDERITFADRSNKLNRPYGMAFNRGQFYVANQDGIRRYPWIRSSRQIAGEGELIMRLDARGHWTRTITFSPSRDKMFVAIGSMTNNDPEPMPRASVQVSHLNGTDQKTFASGLRNPIGLAFHPVTNDLYVSCQERDGLGDDLVPDFFTRIKQDDFYGWPYAYMTPDKMDPKHVLSNGSSTRPDLVARTLTPDVLFQAHSAVLDMMFYTGDQFPSHYKNGAFVALHGSWNKQVATGFKIAFIPFDDKHRPVGYYEDFVDGFLVDPHKPEAFGTPVGLLTLKDGSLLFSEDGNNRIYMVQYKKK